MPPGNVIETNGANHYYITTSTGSLPYGTELIDYECQIDTIPEIRTYNIVFDGNKPVIIFKKYAADDGYEIDDSTPELDDFLKIFKIN